MTIGRLVVDLEGVTARFDDREVPLTATEFRLLGALATAPGRVFTRAELIERALPESDILERTLDSHIKNLRRKLGAAGAPELLRTVRGVGFRLMEGS